MDAPPPLSPPSLPPPPPPRFSPAATCGLLAVVLLTGLSVASSADASLLLLPLLFAPPLVFFYCLIAPLLRPLTFWERRWDAAARVFLGGAIPAAVLATFVEGVLEEEFARSLSVTGGLLSTSFLTFVFVVFIAFIVAASTEEVVKAFVVRSRYVCASVLLPPSAPLAVRARVTIALFLCAGLGFSTVENALYVASSSDNSLLSRALVAIVRGILAMPLHVVCAGLSGLRFAVRDAQEAALHAALLQRAFEGDGVGRAQPVSDTGASPQINAPLGTGATSLPLASPLAVRGTSVPLAPPPLPPVWSFFECLWPAIAVHGLYDFIAIATSVFAPRDAAFEVVGFVISVLGGAIIAVAAFYAYVGQLRALLTPLEAEGRVLLDLPVGAPPCCCRISVARGGQSGGVARAEAAVGSGRGGASIAIEEGETGALLAASEADVTVTVTETAADGGTVAPAPTS